MQWLLLHVPPFADLTTGSFFPQVGDLTIILVTYLTSLLSDCFSEKEPEIWNRRRRGKALWYWLRFRGITMNSWLYLYKLQGSCLSGACPADSSTSAAQLQISSFQLRGTVVLCLDSTLLHCQEIFRRLSARIIMRFTSYVSLSSGIDCSLSLPTLFCVAYSPMSENTCFRHFV